MDRAVSQRPVLAGLGAVAGGALWLLTETVSVPLAGTGALALTVFAWVFAATLMLLAGPVALARAAGHAALVGVAMAGLAALSTRAEALPFDSLGRPLHWLAGFAVVFVPLPFLIAAGRAGGWTCCGSGRRRGMMKRNSAPPPGASSQTRLPRMALANWRQMTRPSPAPPARRDVTSSSGV